MVTIVHNKATKETPLCMSCGIMSFEMVETTLMRPVMSSHSVHLWNVTQFDVTPAALVAAAVDLGDS